MTTRVKNFRIRDHGVESGIDDSLGFPYMGDDIVGAVPGVAIVVDDPEVDMVEDDSEVNRVVDFPEVDMVVESPEVGVIIRG